VTLYPGPQLYSGDRVTFDITPGNLNGLDVSDLEVRIYRQTGGQAEVLAGGTVGRPAFDQVPRARLTWVWDTTGLDGEQALLVWVDPDDEVRAGDESQDNNVAALTVALQPATERPAMEAAAAWTTTASDCCVFHYMTGTAAERDLEMIVAAYEDAIDDVASVLHVVAPHPFQVYLVSRVIGQGGYARDWLALSYLDRNYGGRDLESVLRHEAAHVLDMAAITSWAPALLREGLAVTAAGGHYKPEPIPERAAALVNLNWYVPLEELANDFYGHQHEIGYLEAGAFVTFLIDRYAWDGFYQLYISLDPELETDAQAIDAVLLQTRGTGLEQVEELFLDWLAAHPPAPTEIQDLQITVRLFDAVRGYQRRYEPGADFWSGWLPNPQEAEAQGITADFIRHPRQPENVALETMLIAAQEALHARAYRQAEALLDAVEAVLDRGTFRHPLAAAYLAVVNSVADAGYEAQQIELEGRTARVWAITRWPDLVELRLDRAPGGWTLTE
jgi:hypothetical protein